jgi:hypothetical protein
LGMANFFPGMDVCSETNQAGCFLSDTEQEEKESMSKTDQAMRDATTTNPINTIYCNSLDMISRDNFYGYVSVVQRRDSRCRICARRINHGQQPNEFPYWLF